MTDTLSMKFIVWHGVVEDRNDPLQLGRCRVRILGWHPQNRDAAPTAELPWAFPLQDITSAAMSGIGRAPIGPVEGTWVVGFFRDGENAQEPVMMGTIGGIPQEFPGSEGFSDPNQKYPLSDPTLHGLGEPDTSRLARTIAAEIMGQVSKEHPLVTQKTSVSELADHPGVPIESEGGDIRQIPIALNETMFWVEPPTDAPFVQYPYNHAFETEGGHIQEFDDTEGHERIHTFHKAGTFEEMQPGGDKMVKVVGTNYEIVHGDDNLLVKGNLNITVDEQARLLVNDDLNIEVRPGGDVKIVVRQGNANISLEQGDVNLQVRGNMNTHITGNKTEKIDGQYTLDVGSQYFLRASTVFIRGGTIFLN